MLTHTRRGSLLNALGTGGAAKLEASNEHSHTVWDLSKDVPTCCDPCGTDCEHSGEYPLRHGAQPRLRVRGRNVRGKPTPGALSLSVRGIVPTTKQHARRCVLHLCVVPSTRTLPCVGARACGVCVRVYVRARVCVCVERERERARAIEDFVRLISVFTTTTERTQTDLRWRARGGTNGDYSTTVKDISLACVHCGQPVPRSVPTLV